MEVRRQHHYPVVFSSGTHSTRHWMRPELDLLEKKKFLARTRIRTPDRPAFNLKAIQTSLIRLDGI
jgi:hypothetical protein